MTFTACVSQEIIFFLLQMSSKQLNKMSMMTHIFKSLDCDCDSWLSWLSDDLSPPGVITCWELDLIYWIKKNFFSHSRAFIPKKAADSLLPSPVSCPPSVVSCHSEGERCWREEHMWRLVGGWWERRREEDGKGGRRAYFRTQEWLACCFWVTGDGTPAWCIRTTHTAKCKHIYTRRYL